MQITPGNCSPFPKMGRKDTLLTAIGGWEPEAQTLHDDFVNLAPQPHPRYHTRFSALHFLQHAVYHYAMMESHKSIEAKHLAGGTWGGLCRSGGSGDHAPAPAGACGLSDPQSAVSPGRGCP